MRNRAELLVGGQMFSRIVHEPEPIELNSAKRGRVGAGPPLPGMIAGQRETLPCSHLPQVVRPQALPGVEMLIL